MEPELLEKDGENELTFASFTVEKGGEAVAYDDDDPENAYAKIRYNETVPEVTLYVNYSAGTATIEETGGLDPEDPNTEKAKKYFTDNKLTGTYVTEREEADNSNTRWSIKVAEDGDIFLYFDGENTGASAVADAANQGIGSGGLPSRAWTGRLLSPAGSVIRRSAPVKAGVCFAAAHEPASLRTGRALTKTGRRIICR